MIGRLAVAASLVAVVLGTTPAREARAEGLDGQRFVPAAGAASGFVVERPLVPLHLGWGFGAFAAYGHRPVVVVDRGSDTILAKPLANARVTTSRRRATA
ncbi:MAG: hypothetical protein HYV09_14120 [Deltaproteobacteria bacterium]|nr:hypothetical protein [Deltaproteobacteria bacterium]